MKQWKYWIIRILLSKIILGDTLLYTDYKISLYALRIRLIDSDKCFMWFSSPIMPVSTGTLKYSKESTHSSCIPSDCIHYILEAVWVTVGQKAEQLQVERLLKLNLNKIPFFNKLQNAFSLEVSHTRLMKCNTTCLDCSLPRGQLYTMLHDARHAAPHASSHMTHDARPLTLCFTLLTTTDLSSYQQLLRSKLLVSNLF